MVVQKVIVVSVDVLYSGLCQIMVIYIGLQGAWQVNSYVRLLLVMLIGELVELDKISQWWTIAEILGLLELFAFLKAIILETMQWLLMYFLIVLIGQKKSCMKYFTWICS